MNYLKYCLPALLWPVMNSMAQSPSQQVQPLKIGDALPGITINKLYNYPAGTVSLSAFRGKLLILDFWSTWCASCIELFPKMHRLQTEFGKRLQVLLVNTWPGDDIKKVKPFFEKRKGMTGEGITLPYSLQQTALVKYFPFKYVPHYVWIDAGGKLIAITSQFEVTRENIAAVLAGHTINLHVKNDQLEFDNQQPLFLNDNGGNGNSFLYRSIFTGYQEGLGNTSGVDRDSNKMITRFYMLNTTRKMLLATAYKGRLNLPVNRILVEAADKEGYRYYPEEDTLLYANSYCYEIMLPPATIEELLEYLQQDMYRLLRVSVKNEERWMPCMVLKQRDEPACMLTEGGVPAFETGREHPRSFIRNQPLDILTDLVNNLPAMRDLPVINETGITGNIDIALPAGFRDMGQTELLAFLEKTGFVLEKAVRKIKVAVITNDRP